MKVPKYIRDKMHRVAALERQAAIVMGEIEGWLLRNGVAEEELYSGGYLRCGDGVSLEELEYGDDVTELLVKKLEAM